MYLQTMTLKNAIRLLAFKKIVISATIDIIVLFDCGAFASGFVILQSQSPPQPAFRQLLSASFGFV